MLKQACLLCKIVGAFAIIGALNWGVIGITGKNVIGHFLGADSGLTRVVYVLVGLSGIGLLVSFFTVCPACKKSK